MEYLVMIKHKITFKDIESNQGYWSELFPIQEWNDEELLNYFWELTEVQRKLCKNSKPYQDLINLIIEIDRRNLVQN
tara:strand:- start:634 stop:864 length:231 start_codon:yes stop_codon:yes gene_type:complete